MKSKLFLVVILFSSSTGCRLGSGYEPVAIHLPPDWQNISSTILDPSEPWIRYWEQFQDAELNGFIDELVCSNLDIEIAAAKVRQARADEIKGQSNFWPQIDFVGIINRNNLSSAIPIIFDELFSNTSFNTFYGAFNAVWNLDLFGRTQNGMLADKANIQAARENLHVVQVSMIAEVVRAYLELKNSIDEERLLQKSYDIEKKLLFFEGSFFENGVQDQQQVLKRGIELDRMGSNLINKKNETLKHLFRLEFLLDKQPNTLSYLLEKETCMPKPPTTISCGLPSDLLLKRPDIRLKEQQLIASTYEKNVAICNFLPEFSLFSNLGQLSNLIRTFFNQKNANAVYGMSILAPIFHGGELIGNLRLKTYKQKEAYFAYLKAVLEGLFDVQKSLNAFETRKLSLDFFANMTKKRGEIFELSCALKKNALFSEKDTLLVEQSVLESIKNENQQSLQLALEFIQLNKELGAGWQYLSPEIQQLSEGEFELFKELTN